MKKLSGLLILCLLFSSGCYDTYNISDSPHYDVYINSINNGDVANNRTCYIGSGMKDITVDDLTFKEFLAYLKKSMESRGYSITDNLDNADVMVLLEYGISNPQSNTTAMPIIGQTGISSSNTYGTINSSGSGYSTFSGTTYHTPTYGITGAAPVSYTTYTRYIKMTAYDWVKYKAEEKVMLWETDIVSTGSSSDLRQVFPAMMAAATPYIGRNTGQKLKVTIEQYGKEVMWIKGIF